VIFSFEGTVNPNQTVTPCNVVVPEGEQWRLLFLAIQQDATTASEVVPGTIVLRVMVTPAGEDEERRLFRFSGEAAALRENLSGLLGAGDRVRIQVTSRHHTEPVRFLGSWSVEKLPLQVYVVNQQESANYLHFQTNPSTTWIINHMMGRYPNITTVDSLGRVVEGELHYLDPNTARADFEYAVGGAAFCS